MTAQQDAAASVTVMIEGGPQMTAPFTIGMNAQQALEGAFNSLNDPKQFDYALEYFGSALGYLVVMINGTYETFVSSSQPFYFWEFSVNNVPASAGIDMTILQAGDTVSFELQTYSQKTAAGSTLHAKYQARLRKQ